MFANYCDPGVPPYRDNPFIEALPPILSETDTMQALQQLPLFREADRELPTHLRLHLVQDALRLQFFAPLPTHLRIEQRLSRTIRGGYVRRNPLERGFYHTLNNNVDELANTLKQPGQTWSPSLGFYTAGVPGVGKTETFRRILALYPQVIEHRAYKDRSFCFRQVTHLMLQCPSDASTRSLCVNFLQAMDRVLDTNYWTQYSKRSDKTSKMVFMPEMSRVAGLHGLGVLVIDEIQRLSLAASGGAAEMLNFFAQLVDTIGVPVVLIGTIKALPILAAQFHQARRAADQGDLIWDRMSNDSGADGDGEWRLLTDYLWKYQYTRRFTPLTEELRNVLYEETAGITDLAVKVFMFAQCYTMAEGDEKITAAVIRNVARTNLRMAQPALSAIRRGDSRGLVDYEDMHPQLLRRFLKEYSSCDRIEVVGVAARGGTETHAWSEAEHHNHGQVGGTATEEEKAANEQQTANHEEKKETTTVRSENSSKRHHSDTRAIATDHTNSKSNHKGKKKQDLKTGLLGLVTDGEKGKLSSYDALSRANYISRRGEYNDDGHCEAEGVVNDDGRE
jgi:hypothetical protein